MKTFCVILLNFLGGKNRGGYPHEAIFRAFVRVGGI